MSVLEAVAEEVFGDRDERGRFGPLFTTHRDGDALTVDQLRRLQESNIYCNGNPNGFRRHPEYDNMYECLEDVQEEWPGLKILIDGALYSEDEWWAETVYLLYDDVANVGLFEEWAVLSFESWLTDEKKGVKPSDSRVTFGNERFRYPESDDYLLATTDEFSFRRDEEAGKYVRLWWDD